MACSYELGLLGSYYIYISLLFLLYCSFFEFSTTLFKSIFLVLIILFSFEFILAKLNFFFYGYFAVVDNGCGVVVVGWIDFYFYKFDNVIAYLDIYCRKSVTFYITFASDFGYWNLGRGGAFFFLSFASISTIYQNMYNVYNIFILTHFKL